MHLIVKNSFHLCISLSKAILVKTWSRVNSAVSANMESAKVLLNDKDPGCYRRGTNTRQTIEITNY